MASNEIVPSDNKTVTVQAHTRSAPTPRTNEVSVVTERATFVETADASIRQFERITEFKGEEVSNTPIHDRALEDHIFQWMQPAPEYVPPPRPTRQQAELVVAGIEGIATVRAGLDPITGGLR